MIPEKGVAHLGCPKGKKIDKIVFASYGTPSGNCQEGFKKAKDSKGKVREVLIACLRTHSCPLLPCHTPPQQRSSD